MTSYSFMGISDSKGHGDESLVSLNKGSVNSRDFDDDNIVKPLSRRCKIDRRKIIFIVISISSLVVLCVTIPPLIYLYGNGKYNASDNVKLTEATVPFSNDVKYGVNGSLVLLGDSLISYPCEDFDLIGKIRSQMVGSYGLTNCGVGGNTIQDIRDRLPPIIRSIQNVTSAFNSSYRNSTILNKNSKVMVIMLWDSDCSDISEYGMSSSAVAKLRSKYKENVRYVVQSIINAGAYMALSGPEVLPWYAYKENMLNDYREMNKEVAKEFDMEYIDVRGAFLSAIKEGRMPTLYGDNEHPNNYGAQIMANLYVAAMTRWKGFIHPNQ